MQVTDADNRPLSFVSAVLLHDSLFISGTTTDESGSFSFSYSFSRNKRYYIHLSRAGFLDTTFQINEPADLVLPAIRLQKNSKLLSGVTVTSKAPLVTRKPDRYIINIENSFLSEGNSGLDVLQKSPGIWVNNNGVIRIRGNQPVRIMIDDLVLQIPGEELSIYLSSLKSEDISSIEVISNPPAEFEAAGTGGIIRILLKKGRRKGLNGSVFTQYRYRTGHPLISTGTSLDIKMKNVYLSGGYSIRKDDRYIKEQTNIDHPDQSGFQNGSDRLEDFINHQFRLGISLDPGKKQSAGLQTSWSATDIQQDFFTRAQYHTSTKDISGNAITNKYRKFRNGATTFNYQLKTDTVGSFFKIITGYSYNNKLDTQYNREVYKDSIPESTYRYRLPFTTGIYNAQADYSKKLNRKATLAMGIKYSSIKRDNSVYREDFNGNTWVENAGAGNHFIYTENLLMFYSSVDKRIRDINIKAGLRFEQTTSIGNSVSSSQTFKRTYGGLFPSIFIQQYLDEKKGNSIYLNYARRLSRPSLMDLNPYRFVYNNYTTLTGNPALLPEYAHNISAGFIFKNDYSADLFFNRTENVITLSARAGSNNSLDYLSGNVNGSTEVGVNLAATFAILPGWRINNNATFYRLYYQFEGEKVRQNSYSVKSVHTISVKKGLDIDIVSEYQSPRYYSNIYTLGTFYTDLGLSQKLFSNKASLRLLCTDLFNGIREKEITHTDNSSIVFFRKRQTRSVQLSFTYNFSSGKKFRNAKIEEGSQEEKRRSSDY